LTYFVLNNGTANSTDCLMPNVWLMGENLLGEGNIMAVLFLLATSQKFAGSIPNGVTGIFH
jgi:hypothetical protein